MPSVGIRNLTHNFSRYIREVKRGERIIILERNKPIADIIPHNETIRYPGWKRAITRRRVRGETFSETAEKSRDLE